jgi:hypothetical protein
VLILALKPSPPINIITIFKVNPLISQREKKQITLIQTLSQKPTNKRPCQSKHQNKNQTNPSHSSLFTTKIIGQKAIRCCASN